MARTGHRSIEGVRTYKRISEQQVKDVSTLLNDATNGAPAVKKCKFTQQTEQKTTITNSLVMLFMLVLYCSLRPRNCHKRTYSFSISFQWLF